MCKRLSLQLSLQPWHLQYFVSYICILWSVIIFRMSIKWSFDQEQHPLCLKILDHFFPGTSAVSELKGWSLVLYGTEVAPNQMSTVRPNAGHSLSPPFTLSGLPGMSMSEIFFHLRTVVKNSHESRRKPLAYLFSRTAHLLPSSRESE